MAKIGEKCLDCLVNVLGGLGAALAVPASAAGASGFVASAAVGVPLLGALIGGGLLINTFRNRNGDDCEKLLADARQRVLKRFDVNDPTSLVEQEAREALETDLANDLSKCLPEGAAAIRAFIADNRLDGSQIAAALLARAPEDSRFHKGKGDEAARRFFADVVCAAWQALREDAGFTGSLRSHIDERFFVEFENIQVAVGEIKQDTTEIKEGVKDLRAMMAQLVAWGSDPAQVSDLQQRLSLRDDLLANLIGLVLRRRIQPQEIIHTIEEANARAAADAEQAARIPNDESEELRDLRVARLSALQVRDLDRATDLSFTYATARDRGQLENWQIAARDAENALDFRRAANAWAIGGARAETLPPEQRFEWFHRELSALHRLWRDIGDKAALDEGLARCGWLKDTFASALDPQISTRIQNWSGIFVYEQGKRQGIVAVVREASEIHSAALGHHMCHDVALRNMVQANLNATLIAVGEMEANTLMLERAVSDFEDVARARLREKCASCWARAQYNLGAALLKLAEDETNGNRAIAIFRRSIGKLENALLEYSPEKDVFRWAEAQNVIGYASTKLAIMEDNIENIKSSADLLKSTIEAVSKETNLATWRQLNINLGIALHACGEREEGVGYFFEALGAYLKALDSLDANESPKDWANIQMNIANSLGDIGLRTRNSEPLIKAIDIYDTIVGIARSNGDTGFARRIERNREATQRQIANLKAMNRA